MYDKPSMPCFKYLLYHMYGTKAITSLNDILWVVTEPAPWVVKQPPFPLQAILPTTLFGSIAFTHSEENSRMHCKDKMPKIWKQIFPEKEYRGLSPNFHIHVSVNKLYIPTMGLPFLLEEICEPILGICKSLRDTWMWKLGLRPRNSQKRNI